ncbi:leishmanolysin family protein, putative [Ichthyophthirius multifiliis]|uniref:Leishmanolysin family protein, putative n=1 Tax=Ichthyophthirius multifiliis TaxID=5932 RepID=G0QLU8_ICHMU|nr:leishmanolysin family protein, putative [Ichthyophthirius multifiliis]EGR33806.1 leishmanolysin family protein, putative [Ichthyophthirius multifiliis]|eukprot:XP_004039030.1 leishmanolysin family protein, putative [Ichthyophthirius multifiliis]
MMHYWIDPITKEQYKKNYEKKLLKQKLYKGNTVFILTSKNVVEVTKKYYNCPTAEGMYLENTGGEFTIGSHWKRTFVYNELMTGSELNVKSTLSMFTIALLKDTGFYSEVNENMAGQLFWGKGKGCDFLENVCQSKTKYPEFPQKVDDFQCSFEYEGFGDVKIYQSVDKCQMVYPEMEDLCTNPNAIEDEEDLEIEEDKLSDYSNQSKCFQSTAVKSSSQYTYDTSVRCHRFKCSSDASEISVIFPDIQLQVLCGIGDQGKQKDIDKSGKKAKGQITCPQDYNRFCNNSRICPNFCSQKGVCVNGQCICQSGYGGENCITKCSGVVNDGRCIQSSCPSGKFKNPDNTCKSDCPQGFYGKDGNCEPCHNSCSRCTGPLLNQCTKCQFLTLLQDNQCVEQCDEKQGYKSNYDLRICESQSSTKCQGNCQTCEKKNSPLCITCKQGFYKQADKSCQNTCAIGSQLTQNSQECVKPFDGCLQYKDSNTCIKCDTSKNYRLGSDKKCTLCNQNCSQCNPKNPSECLVCEGVNLKSHDSRSCLNICPGASFYSDSIGKCQQCPLRCQNCNENGCKKCQNGYYIDSKTKACTQCLSKHTNCTSCDDPNCLQCNDNLKKKCLQTSANDGNLGSGNNVINGTNIIKCPTGCKICNQSKQCSQCNQGFILDDKTKKCITCIQKYGNCIACTENKCTTCFSGHTYNEKLKQCTKIDSSRKLFQIQGDDQKLNNYQGVYGFFIGYVIFGLLL